MTYLMRLERVLEKTGLTRTPLYNQVKEGIFPPPIKIDARAIAWISSEVDAYVNARIAGKCDAKLKELCEHMVSRRQGGGY